MANLWLGYASHDDETILAAAAAKFHVHPDELELKRNAGAVLVRVKEEEGKTVTSVPVSNLHFKGGVLCLKTR